MKKEYPGTMRDFPEEILICHVMEDNAIEDNAIEDNAIEDYAIEELSEQHVVFRMEQSASDLEEPSKIKILSEGQKKFKISFFAFFLNSGGYESFGPFQIEEYRIERREFDQCVCAEISDSEFSKMVRRISREYQNYIFAKSDSIGASFSERLVGYPAGLDEEFAGSYEEWKNRGNRKSDIQNLAQRLAFLVDEKKISLAAELDRPELYRAFLTDGREQILPECLVGKISHVYIGNAYCPFLFPEKEELGKLFTTAWERGLGISIVLSRIEDERDQKARNLLQDIIELCKLNEQNSEKIELEINDWGWLELLSEIQTEYADGSNPEKSADRNFSIALGRLLNKRRKDPRYKYKAAWKAMEEECAQNSLNDPGYCNFLKKNGIESAELESCGYRQQIPDFSCHLHLPFYQTNTSKYCPITALVNYGDRGHQSRQEDCPKYCEHYTLAYPEHLSMVGKYNSLFALDTDLMTHPEQPEQMVQAGIRRIVWNYE